MVFVTLFLVFGVAITLYGHHENRQLALIGARGAAAEVAERTRGSLAALYLPVQGLIDLASKSLLRGGRLRNALVLDHFVFGDPPTEPVALLLLRRLRGR